MIRRKHKPIVLGVRLMAERSLAILTINPEKETAFFELHVPECHEFSLAMRSFRSFRHDEKPSLGKMELSNEFLRLGKIT